MKESGEPSSASRRVTMKDVAREAGVSDMTVSRVLRRQGKTAAKTREAVLAAVEKLGYRPNPMVQALMSSVRRRSVGSEANLAWLDQRSGLRESLQSLRTGARERALELGFGMEVIRLRGGLTPDRIRHILLARGVVGCVVAPLLRTGARLELPWDGFAFATIGPSLSDPALNHAMAHQLHLIQRVIDEVEARGYRRVGFLLDQGAERRSESLQSILSHAYNRGIPAVRQVEPVIANLLSDAKLASWYERERPEVIITSYPKLIDRLRKLALPELERTDWATFSWWPEYAEVAGVRHPLEALGAAAVDMVVAQVHRNERGTPELPKTLLIEGEWVEGTSLKKRNRG